MVIANCIFEDYVIYIGRVFNRFVEYNIVIKGSKCFIGYLSTIVLNQKVNAYSLFTHENRFIVLSKIAFPKNIWDLKHFLSIIGHFRYHYKDYASIIRSL